jgi:hypothetical protein
LEGALPWDLIGKALVKECAQDFLTYFAEGATYVGMRNAQLQTQVGGPFEPREIRADMVPEAMRGGERMLMDIEWRSTKDTKMAERLLFYSCELTREYGVNVRSVVIYLQSVSNVPKPALERSIPGDPLPDGNLTIWFNFASLEVSAKYVEEFRSLRLDAFSVLMLLCKDGGTIAVLEEALECLLKHKEERKESMVAAFFFASKVLTSEKDRKFMERKREMLKDTLRDSWLYQKILGEGREEGREVGREEGREEGRVEEAQMNIEDLVEDKFPTLLAWVEKRVEQITDLTTLRTILRVVGRANSAEDVKAAFPSQH